MSAEKVSVVIPCYNQGNFLNATVESVISTTHKNIEIIIINDGSTDNSLEVAHAIKHKYPEIIVIDQQNGGVSKSRNTGIKIASGKFILPLDGDDLISQDYIALAVKTFNSDDNIKVVYSKAVKFNEKGQKKWKLKSFSLNKLATDNMIFVSALFKKTDALTVGGFSEDMTMGREDWEFWIKMLKNGGSVVQLPIIGFYYRLSPNSKRKRTGTKEKKIERIKYLNNKHAEFFERYINGPLRINRSWSSIYNKTLKIFGRL